MKAAVRAIRLFEAFANTGVRGKITQKFFSGLLKLIKPRGKKILENLQLVYPESSSQWREDLRSQVYEQLSWTLTEFLALQRDKSQIMHWVKKVHGLDVLDKALSEKKGVVLMSAHFGNWELFGGWVGQYFRSKGRDYVAMSQTIHDPDVNEYIVNAREKCGIKLIDKNTSVMKLVRMLKSGTFIAALNDVSGTPKMRVPFMGHDATNVPGVAVMAMLSGVNIIPCCCYRVRPFEHEAAFFEPLKLPDDKGMTHDERLRIAVQECNNALEKFIKSRPELWFWLHNRWRD